MKVQEVFYTIATLFLVFVILYIAINGNPFKTEDESEDDKDSTVSRPSPYASVIH